MVMTFREALLKALSETGASLSAVSEGAKVSYEQLKKVRARPEASTNADDAVKVAHYFGMTLDEFLQDHLAEDRALVIAKYTQLTDAEREMLRVLGRAQGAQPPAED